MPNGPIDVKLRQVLRLGIFELLELGKPDHVVSDHVDLAKRYVQPHIVRVANGATCLLERGISVSVRQLVRYHWLACNREAWASGRRGAA